MEIVSPASISLPEPQPVIATHGDLHDVTPTGRASWYGREVAVEDRSAFSHTGDVALIAGNTFGVHYATAGAAINRAQAASRDGQGAVMVFATAHDPVEDAALAGVQTSGAARDAEAREAAATVDYSLARAYNVEFRNGQGYVIERSALADHGVRNFAADARYLIEGDRVITATH